jgi:hypothetical protein
MRFMILMMTILSLSFKNSIALKLDGFRFSKIQGFRNTLLDMSTHKASSPGRSSKTGFPDRSNSRSNQPIKPGRPSRSFSTKPTELRSSSSLSTAKPISVKSQPAAQSQSKLKSKPSYPYACLPQSPQRRSGSGNGQPLEVVDFRVNKCLGQLSRRAADIAIASGRVMVNGVLAVAGQKVSSGDSVRLDGKLQKWEHHAKAKSTTKIAKHSDEREFIYLKYFKPVGVTCTSDPSDPNNIIRKGRFALFPQRRAALSLALHEPCCS